MQQIELELAGGGVLTVSLRASLDAMPAVYGVILDIISQRPVEISDTVIAQCNNFLIFKMTHPLDIKYIGEMLPNISQDILDKQKVLQPGTCVCFGGAFKIPMIVKLEMPNPMPYSSNCDVSNWWKMENNPGNIEEFI